MKNKLILALMIMGCMALPGCGENTTQDKQNISVVDETAITREESSVEDVTIEELMETVDSEVDREEENETGSFTKMRITYGGKYRINFRTKTNGHPSRGVDFTTDMGWKDEKLGIQGGCIIDYYVYDGHNIESDYEDYEHMEEAEIGDKSYKVIRGEETLELLYKLDDSFYIRVMLWNASQFDAEGSSMELSVTPSDYLDRGWLQETITFDVTPVD